MFSTTRLTNFSLSTQLFTGDILLKKCAVPWDLIVAYLKFLDLCSGWESRRHGRVLRLLNLRDHKGEQDKVMAAGLLDGDVCTGVLGLPTHRQLGIVCYDAYDGAVRDESKVLPLIEVVTENLTTSKKPLFNSIVISALRRTSTSFQVNILQVEVDLLRMGIHYLHSRVPPMLRLYVNINVCALALSVGVEPPWLEVPATNIDSRVSTSAAFDCSHTVPSLTYAHPEESTFSQTSVTQITITVIASLPIPQVRLLLTGTPALVPTPSWLAFIPQEILATATLVPPESTPTSTSAFMTETPHEPMDEECASNSAEPQGKSSVGILILILFRGRPRLLPQSA
ncbi:hypothetical protein Pelo_18861 [Pelomyxa schiedti]|nr:hypothetical protein Pelo_18861 [Pelomyxa schiedti]